MAVIVERGEPVKVPDIDIDAEYRATALFLLGCIECKTRVDETTIATLTGVSIDGKSLPLY